MKLCQIVLSSVLMKGQLGTILRHILQNTARLTIGIVVVILLTLAGGQSQSGANGRGCRFGRIFERGEHGRHYFGGRCCWCWSGVLIGCWWGGLMVVVEKRSVLHWRRSMNFETNFCALSLLRGHHNIIEALSNAVGAERKITILNSSGHCCITSSRYL